MKRLNWIISGLASVGTIVLFVIMFSSMGVEEFINRPLGRNYEKGVRK